jgi:inhibitor of cysteine peptidase
MQRHQLSEADNGAVVSVHSGDEVELSLHEKPSGGYRWLPDDLPSDLLEQVEQRFAFEEGSVGGSNATRFLFRVKAVGRGTLRLRYDRPWDTGEPPLKTYEATVVAR